MIRRAKFSSLAKINLDLRVLGKRADGYHELRTVFQSISLADTIEIVYEPARRTELAIEDDPGIPNNLILRAAEACLEAMKHHARITFRLAKRIPMGAGLGGGSSNAAAILIALPVLAGRRLELQELMAVGHELGSDVPFFLMGGTALGLGRGTELYPLADVSPGPLLVVAPGISVSTADAYAGLGLKDSSSLTVTQSSSKLNGFRRYVMALAEVRSAWQAGELSSNDFEAAVFQKYPQLKKVHRELGRLANGSGDPLMGEFRKAGEFRMTGSGSSMFRLFASAAEREHVERLLESVRQGKWADGLRWFPAELVSRRGYRALWRRQLKEHVARAESVRGLWPLPSRYDSKYDRW